MKPTHLWSYLLLAAIVLPSCRARFYTPNRNPVPLFKNKGDVYMDASTNLLNKVDVTGGYALTDNFGAYIGYGGAAQGVSSDSGQESYKYRGNLLNIGAGYFLNSRQDERFRFEVFADYAGGSFKNSATKNGNDYYFNGRFKRLSIMPTIGYSEPGGHFDIAYTLRAGLLSFSDAKYNDPQFWRTDLDRYHKTNRYSVLEQAVTTRFGGKLLKFQVQGAVYRNVNINDDLYAVAPVNFSLIFGIVLNLSAGY